MDRFFCGQVRRHLALLVGGPGGEPVPPGLGAHLETCPACAGLVKKARRTAALVAALPAARAPEGLLEGVWGRVEATPELARLLASLPVRPAPAEVDLAVQRGLKAFLWSRSREARVVRFVAATLAAAASLLLCLALWYEAPRPVRGLHLVQETRPPAGWATHEADQLWLHGRLSIPPAGGENGKEGRPSGR